jgi:small neutral amino acid transporter SnatA (MarC family)
VFLGSMFWWIALSASVGVFHKRLNDNTINLLTHIFGGILATIGITVIISTLV